MPRELPAELRVIADCELHIGKFEPKCWMCRSRKDALLAAIPIVERMTVKDVAKAIEQSADCPTWCDVCDSTAAGLDTNRLREECKQLLDANRSGERFGCDVFSCPENSEMLDFLTGEKGFGIDKVTNKPRGLVILDLSRL